MLAISLAAVSVQAGDPVKVCSAETGICWIRPQEPIEAMTCSSDPNAPDRAYICVMGKDRRLKLMLEAPPCGTPEAKAEGRCIPWESIPKVPNSAR
jgi:hypothetical protein